jgi:prepilin-type N-terminal cleavage/methylation domain-containing protein
MRIERLHDDDGMTVIELLVAMLLLGVVSSLVVVGVRDAVRILTQTDDENRGLQDAKVILDRLSRDIREARGVVCDDPAPAVGDPVVDAQGLPTRCPDYVQLWIDDDSDYLEDTGEVVTWELTESADGIHFDVWRCKGALGGSPCDAEATGVQRKLQASALIVRTLFNYADVAGNPVQPEDATLVRLRMDYDAIAGRGVDVKQASVSARLRNKG